ncbi:SRPBCC family protein [Aquimarina sp. 2304DJ70-9]|uniref:SRPBCC family protein n=1 Tax=Aquimarina penaris TaxID=3231044 RepID=UPI003461B7BB
MKSLNVKSFTNAPEQIQVSRLVEASIDNVWKVVADHQGMTQWMPMIKHVHLVKPDAKGTWGEGCERHCQFGNDLLQEKIVHWDPPYGYAYSIADMHIVKNHVGHIELMEKMDGTLITWTQYFEPQGNFVKKWMAKNIMLPQVMKKALKNLEKKTAA